MVTTDVHGDGEIVTDFPIESLGGLIITGGDSGGRKCVVSGVTLEAIHSTPEVTDSPPVFRGAPAFGRPGVVGQTSRDTIARDSSAGQPPVALGPLLRREPQMPGMNIEGTKVGDGGAG